MLWLQSSWPPEYTKIISYKYFKLSLQIYVIVVRIKKTYTFSLFLLWKQTIRFSAIGIFLLYIPATVSNAVDYAKKNDVLPTIFTIFSSVNYA